MVVESQLSKEVATKSNALYGSFPEEDTEKSKKIKYTSVQLITLICLAFGNFSVGACVSLQAPFFPSEAERKGATPTEFGLIFGIFQLLIFTSAPLMAKLVTYASPKLVLNCGILIVGVTCILFGTLDLIDSTKTFVALAFTIRAVEGVAAAALRTSTGTITASQFYENMGTTFAILETFVGVGLIAGPTLGGALYDVGGYGLPFYVLGSVVIVDAVVIFFVLPDVERKEQPKRESLIKFWLYPSTLIYSFSVFTSFNTVGFFHVTLEPHIRKLALSGFYLGMLFALAGAVYAISSPVWGWLIDKKCNSRVLCFVGSLLCATCVFFCGPAPVMHMDPNLLTVIISLILLGLGMGAKLVSAFTGTIKETISRGMPPGVSTYGLVSSMIASSQSLGAFIGPSLGGIFLDKFGFRNASMIYLGVVS